VPIGAPLRTLPCRRDKAAIAKEFNDLCSTDRLADHHRAIDVNAVNLKYRLRNIETDRDNLAHGRLPSMWFASTQPSYGTSMPQSGRRPPHHSHRSRAPDRKH
jgi:hypothetical protein